MNAQTLKNNPDLCNLTQEALVQWCNDHSHPPYRARQVYAWLWKQGVRTFGQMSDLPAAFRKNLEQDFSLRELLTETSQKSTDGTVKYSFRLHDGHAIESVLIPSGKRTSACISVQAGCPLGCTFCATGRYGYFRDLQASEIFDQVVALNRVSEDLYGHDLSNIIYMGMGEPLLNYEATVSSIGHITDEEYGSGMSPRRITVSTSGVVSGIKRLADDDVKFNLAVSLHTANQKKREKIMPLARKYPLDLLSDALEYFHNRTGKRITIEYLLLGGFNDNPDDAAELSGFCRNFPVKINLIEYNPVEGIPYEKTREKNLAAFNEYLLKKNMVVNIRKSRGRDIQAACGQLANAKQQ